VIWHISVIDLAFGVYLHLATMFVSTSVMCPSHFCRVSVTSPSSQSHL